MNMPQYTLDSTERRPGSHVTISNGKSERVGTLLGAIDDDRFLVKAYNQYYIAYNPNSDQLWQSNLKEENVDAETAKQLEQQAAASAAGEDAPIPQGYRPF